MADIDRYDFMALISPSSDIFHIYEPQCKIPDHAGYKPALRHVTGKLYEGYTDRRACFVSQYLEFITQSLTSTLLDFGVLYSILAGSDTFWYLNPRSASENKTIIRAYLQQDHLRSFLAQLRTDYTSTYLRGVSSEHCEPPMTAKTMYPQCALPLSVE